MLPRVFDIFMQGAEPGRNAQSGLGLGLTLVRALVQMHGGTVEARSSGVGLGSEFVVRLPLASGPPPPPSRDQSRNHERCPISGFWSWMTTGTPPTASGSCCEPTAPTCAWPTTATRR